MSNALLSTFSSRTTLYHHTKTILTPEAEVSLALFKKQYPGTRITATYGKCTGVPYNKPCTAACSATHQPSGVCPHDNYRDSLIYSTLANKTKGGKWRPRCLPCERAYKKHMIATDRMKKSTEAVKKCTGGVFSRPDNVQHDLERINSAVHFRFMTAAKVRGKKNYINDPAPDPSKLISLLIVAAHDGQVSGAEYNHPRPPEELAKMLVSMNGIAQDWYSGLPIRLSGGPVHERVAWDRTRPDLAYDDPEQLIVPTQQATNLNASSTSTRSSGTSSRPRIYEKFAPDAPPIDESNLRHFDWRLLQIHRSQRSATDTRNAKPVGAGLPPLDQPWSLEELKDSFMKEEGQCAITGGSVLDSRIYWSLSCDRNTDDLPYNEKNIQWMPWPLNRAKSAFSFFKDRKSLEAEEEKRGIDDPKQLVKEIMLEWLVPLLENFKPRLDLLLSRLAANERPPDMWDGDEPVKEFFKDGGGRILIHDEDIYDWLEGWEAQEQEKEEEDDEDYVNKDEGGVHGGSGGEQEEDDELSDEEMLAGDAIHRVSRNI
ncbi:Proteophosphoglycan ppg4 [Rhodotorula toruloides ATCC 204091]|uniref:Proteophosphoglycan ppg4 n=1 Tax=Rhodotorula toruloides TaxID=5286 RepID=A0A0K3C8B0_RHOTO|nr:Proteophosphoglycan ppg4 [Rhodotorula toruloides ATCC 204091]KAK4333835.1 Proteophosphoglycan ppg4 [Rhodotorula toruloides]PRQ76630.1 Proteophosphoglycan ppg4 [Rhodotorula toruloides]